MLNLRSFREKRKAKKNASLTSKSTSDLSSTTAQSVQGLSKPPAPPILKNDNVQLRDTNSENRVNSVKLINSIRNTLGDFNSDTDSDLDFPIRNNQDAKEYLKKLSKLENKQHALILEQERQLEVNKMKWSDSDILNYSMTKAHKKYVAKNKYGTVSTSKPVNIYLESISSVFNDNGDVLKRYGSIRHVGTAEFNPAGGLEIKVAKNSTNRQLELTNGSEFITNVNNDIDNPESEEKMIIKEIEAFEKKQADSGKVTPGKYFYKGKQIYPAVTFNETNNSEHVYDSKQKISSSALSKKMSDDLKFISMNEEKEVVDQIIKDLVTEHKINNNIE